MITRYRIRKTFACLAALALGLLVCQIGYADESSKSDPFATIVGRIAVLRMDGEPASDFRDAVVFLDGVSNHEIQEQVVSTINISQKGASFAPHVAPVVVGSTIRFLNDDNIFHNVFSLSKTATFDLGIFPKGTFKAVTLEKTGLVNVYCNIHPDMVSRILVLNTPWFATTDANGHFQIHGIAPGDYTLRVWHELGGDALQPITLSAGIHEIGEIKIRSTSGSLSHRNKFGKPYRSKY